MYPPPSWEWWTGVEGLLQDYDDVGFRVEDYVGPDMTYSSTPNCVLIAGARCVYTYIYVYI